MYNADKHAKQIYKRHGDDFQEVMLLNMRSKPSYRPKREFGVILLGLWETFHFIRHDNGLRR